MADRTLTGQKMAMDLSLEMYYFHYPAYPAAFTKNPGNRLQGKDKDAFSLD